MGKANSTSTPDIATTLLAQASDAARNRMTTLRVLTNVLREEMQAMHGGIWRVRIDHDDQLIVIAPSIVGPIARPDCGETV